METITMKMRGRKVTHGEALESAQRLINSHFHNPDGARVSIPVRPDNDDVLVMDYILEQQGAASPEESLIAEVEEKRAAHEQRRDGVVSSATMDDPLKRIREFDWLDWIIVVSLIVGLVEAFYL